MKSVILIFLLTYTTISLLAQDSLSNKGSYFTVSKRNNGASQILAVGDKVVINLKGNTFIHGKILEANRDYILINSNQKIEIINIKWIKKNKPPKEHLVFGIILTTAGTALLIPLLAGTVDFDSIEIHTGATIALLTAGIAFLTPPKYKLHKGDTMIFKE